MEIQSKKLAVLIDADNASISSVSSILEEVAKYGIASVKRIYGDWSNPALKGWYDIALKYGMTPVQQYAYTVSKNATDIAMVIDAMELLYTGTFQGFCIISSDSDFTPLALKIREKGLFVHGFGKSTTPISFVSACDKFIDVKNLVVGETIDLKESTNEKVTQGQISIDKDVLTLILKTIRDKADEHGWANLLTVNQYISVVKPDFDSRAYGRAKFSGLIRSLELFEIKEVKSQLLVRKRTFKVIIKLAQEALKVASNENNWVNINTVVENIKNLEPELNIEPYGFESIEKAIFSINGGWVEFSGNKIKLGKTLA
ncbi:NYN domain-containing protein [Acinetobacter sp. ANC 5380]|uniref:NYN domain-containing protein n=1 Tax=Acinetobacter terrae TaxID=2731247 RepID=A0A241VKK5_9GAMM|nr:NYN domain-containing protein [Acinetobacter terrae]NNH78194.1 NYN domain-containing protein [Acinetobacter terrae]OTG78208.1 nuclease [Acinetobacter terrae]